MKDEKITNMDIVLYAISELGGINRSIYSEDIAAKSFNLNPIRFSWKLSKYEKRGWPDKYIVKTALEDAKKKENGHLVEGSYALDLSKDGWTLTSNGVIWLKHNKSRLEHLLKTREATISELDKKRYLKRMRSQKLYQQYLSSDSLNSSAFYEFTDMLDCSPDAENESIRLKFDRLLASANLIEDELIISFLKACEKRYLFSNE